MPFYLSDTIEKVFDEAKVGTNTSGKYLIVKGGNAKHGFNLFVCEIMGISDTDLSIKYNVYSAKTTIGGVKFVENFTKVQDMTLKPVNPKNNKRDDNQLFDDTLLKEFE